MRRYEVGTMAYFWAEDERDALEQWMEQEGEPANYARFVEEA